MSVEKSLDVHLQVPVAREFPEGNSVKDALAWLNALLGRMHHCVFPEALPHVVSMQDDIRNFEVRVSLVGQVKAGKTALTNSLIGKPGMLPSDVNPWTSVVTSVHINTQKPRDHRAVFTFFTQEEWDDMVTVGGRLGEVAQRANFDEEFAEVQDQIVEMQTKAERRLGRNFKLLLGRSHNFNGFHPELIKRYVCLGDEEDEDGGQEGRFADLTKSADLYIEDTQYALPTIIRDTPGVNDPFLVRETVTLDNLSESEICVIVLSAHQTFTTVDIALMRILMGLRHEQIILFINRIDELRDPDRQIVEIDRYVRQTLADQGLPKDLPIIFGSALWSNAAAFGVTEGILGDSVDTLQKLVSDRLAKDPPKNEIQPAGAAETTHAKVTDLSGLAELQHVIQLKSAQSVGAPFLQKLRRRAIDICQQSTVLMRQTLDNATPIRADLDVDALIDQLDQMLKEIDDACRQVTTACSEKMLYDMSAAYRSFIDTETRALNGILNGGGTTTDWTPDTDNLRRELNTAYRDFSVAGTKAVQEIFDQAAERVTGFYADILDQDSQLFSVAAPKAHEARTPTSLMQSMTIDITAGWLETWFTRKVNKSAFAKRLESIVSDEMRATIKDMQDIYIVDFIKHARIQLHDFLVGHINTLQNLSVLDGSEQKSVMRRKLGMDAELNNRLVELSEIEAELTAGRPVTQNAA